MCGDLLWRGNSSLLVALQEDSAEVNFEGEVKE